MSESDLRLGVEFVPDRRKGLLQYGFFLLLLAGGAGVSLFFLVRSTGELFILWLIIFLGCLAFLPTTGFSLYGLLNAVYRVSREGLRLRWGMREIFIPMEQVEWVRVAESVSLELHYPRLYRTGIVRGITHSRELGKVEYMASDPSAILLIATSECIYAASPKDASGFTRAVQHAIESGNLSPVEGYSTQPSTFFSELWEDRTTRGLVAAGIAFNFGLLVIINMIIPRQAEIILGFTAGGQAMPAIPSSSLRLLSMLSIVLGGLDFILGVNFYRKTQYRTLSYLLWGTAGLLPLLFILVMAIAVR